MSLELNNTHRCEITSTSFFVSAYLRLNACNDKSLTPHWAVRHGSVQCRRPRAIVSAISTHYHGAVGLQTEQSSYHSVGLPRIPHTSSTAVIYETAKNSSGQMSSISRTRQAPATRASWSTGPSWIPRQRWTCEAVTPSMTAPRSLLPRRGNAWKMLVQDVCLRWTKLQISPPCGGELSGPR